MKLTHHTKGAGIAAMAVAGLIALPTSAHASGSADPHLDGISQLNAVSADSPSDVWSVGSFDNQHGQGPRIRHWNGTRWRVSHNQDADQVAALEGVDAQSPTDVWAVGVDTGFQHTLIEHWNGHTWSRVPSPAPGGSSNSSLSGVDATGPADAWAVGTYDTGGSALIEHWDGTSWTQVPASSPGTATNTLSAVTAISATDAWAVGNYADDDGVFKALVEHWNGTSWRRVNAPNPGGAGGTFVSSVTATSATDAWAVGSFTDPDTGFEAPLVEHWNGSAWSTVDSPDFGPQFSVLYGVSAVSAGDAWLVGRTLHRGIIEHWDGTAWTVSHHPAPQGHRGNVLGSVSADSAGDAWTVGFIGQQASSLTLHWNGSDWTVSD